MTPPTSRHVRTAPAPLDGGNRPLCHVLWAVRLSAPASSLFLGRLQALVMVEENEKSHVLKIAELHDELHAEAADLED